MARLLIFFSKMAYKAQRTLFQGGFTSDIEKAIDPDIVISRYGRMWRFSKPIYKHEFVMGKLGYMTSGKETKTYYDEKRKDFIEQPVDMKQGHYVQWVVDLSTQVIAFETKPPDIRYQSFVGAFKDLLNENPDTNLTIESIVESDKFFEWAKKVDRVTKFTAKLRTPNPDFASRPRIIRELLEDTDADSAKVEINKNRESDETLNTEKTIRDLVEYGEEGYSTVIAHGFKDGTRRIFDSKRQTPIERIDVFLPIGVEKIWNHIVQALKKFRK